MRIVRHQMSWRILKPEWIKRSECLLNLSLEGGYRISELCAVLDCSERYLHSVFLRDIGLPPKEWMHRNRMVRARHLVRAEVDDDETSRQLGFSHPNSFRREFVKVYGMTPKAFRERAAHPSTD